MEPAAGMEEVGEPTVKGRTKLRELRRIERAMQQRWRRERLFEANPPDALPSSKYSTPLPLHHHLLRSAPFTSSRFPYMH